ncbi:unnamed protein product [Staurois parvus]|uniref:Uncharacterized protein n=1 Tax=Staurois parvus TaxID=386267 RepID=A0ABN9EHM5_9NEOB|nr:unnamed protein product [Staurois parvus]
MMEDRPPLTSPDGSSNGNPIDRCPCPLYSRDSTQEHQEIPQENQRENPVKVEVKEEETYVMGDDPCKEEILPEISPDTRETRRDIKAEEEENVKIEEEEGTPEISPDTRETRYVVSEDKINHMRIKVEETSPEISPDGSSNGNRPERCPRPLYSQDSTQEHQEIPQEDQYKRLKNIKTEVTEKAEETNLRGDKSFKKEEIPPEISPDLRVTQRNVKAEAEEEKHMKAKGKAVLEIGMDGQYTLQNVKKKSHIFKWQNWR